MRSSSRRWPTRPSCSRRTSRRSASPSGAWRRTRMIRRGSESTLRAASPTDGSRIRPWRECARRAGRPGRRACRPRRPRSTRRASTASRSSSSSSRASASHSPSSSMVSMPASASSCSSSMSPTISSTTSSIVTRPSVPPNSSTTIARWVRWLRIRASRSITPIDSGTNKRLAHQRGDRAVARRIDVGDEHVLDVDHADHLIEAFAIDRQAAVAGVGEGADQLVEADASTARR